jgi:hypothetical protein
VADVLVLISAAIDTVKRLRDVSQRIKNADAKNAVADLSMALADIKMEVAALKEENLRLKEELDALGKQADLRSKLELRDDVYYFTESVGGRPDGPYCPRCLDADDKLIPVKKLTGYFVTFGRWSCPNCESHYGPAE